MNHNSRIGFVVFGLGRAGLIHAGNILRNPQAKLKWIVDPDTERAEEFVSSNLLDTEVVVPSDAGKALSDHSVHAAVVTTPTHLHEDIVLSCLRNGKAVLCEKPIATTVEAVESCYQEAKTHNVPLLCAFNRRFDPTLQSVAEAVRNGDIGKVHVIKTTSRDSPLPSVHYLEISGGIFHDCGVHDVDVICWIMEETPHTVFCMAHAFHESVAALNDVDTVAVVMKFPSGAIGQIDLSREAVYGYDQRVEVFGSRGMVTSDNTSSLSLTHSNHKAITRSLLKFSFPQRYEKAYEQEMCHFINAIRNKEDLQVSKDDVLRCWRVVDAIEQSFHGGKPVILK